jgi:tripartite-type tricarboxylate transporter receptor subunit TctC
LTNTKIDDYPGIWGVGLEVGVVRAARSVVTKDEQPCYTTGNETEIQQEEVYMFGQRFALLAVSFALAFVTISPVQAQSFFEGKTMRIIVGFSAGGGYDTYARAIGRHLGKHIPGNPTVIVDNMTGAGSLISANHLYKAAKPDGLTMAHFSGSLFMGQVLGQQGIEFDAKQFEFIGAAVGEGVVCGLTKASGITSVDKWMASKTPVKLGGNAPGVTPDNAARIVKAALGLPIQVITGHKGTSAIRLSIESGELAGACWSWQSMKVTWRNALENGDAVVVLQAVAKPFPDLPNVPLAINLAKTDEARRLLKVGIQDAAAYARPFVLPPGTPKERIELLRKAFHDTLKDKEFLAEAEKAKLMLDPITGDELRDMVADLGTLDAAFLGKLKGILYD